MNPGAENNNLAAKNSIVSLALENLGFAMVHIRLPKNLTTLMSTGENVTPRR